MNWCDFGNNGESQRLSRIGEAIRYKKGRLAAFFRNISILFSFVSLSFSLKSVCFSFVRVVLFWFCSFNMSQSDFLGKGLSEKMVNSKVPRRRIKLSHFDNSNLIAGYSKTLIGRCMNPRLQDMKTLLFMLPRIWGLEGRVAGADLGLGRFQFDFESEEDIAEVLKMEPLHFDHWMVSLVRWSPSVHPNYPSAITFWVHVLGVPIEFWAEEIFREIGEDLGKVEAVDINGGRVRVTVDGFKPLCFETEIEFGTGEETVMFLRYERLYGFCSLCHSLCHAEEHCALNPVNGVRRADHALVEAAGSQFQSFKGAVIQDNKRDTNQAAKSNGGHKDKEVAVYRGDDGARLQKGNANGASSSRYKQFQNYIQYNEYRHAKAARKEGRKQQLGGVKENAKEHSVDGAQAIGHSQPKQVRKALFVSGESEAAGRVNEDMKKDAMGLEPNGVADFATVEVTRMEVSEEAPAVVSSLVAALDGVGVAGVSVTVNPTGQEVVMSNCEIAGDDLLVGSAPVCEDGEVPGSEQISDGEDMECENVADMTNAGDHLEAEGTDGVAGRRRGPIRLQGISSKKRNAHLLSSPRRRQVHKGAEQVTEGKNPRNQNMAKGAAGGGKPPKHKVDK